MSCNNKQALLSSYRLEQLVSLWSSEDCLSGCCLRSSRDLKRNMDLTFCTE